jgi:hypothetical protein
MLSQNKYIKIILLLISLSTFLNADFLLFMEKSGGGFSGGGSEAYCITDYYYLDQKLYFLQSGEEEYDSKDLEDYKTISIDAGYIFDEDENCVIANISTTTYEAIDDLDMNNYINFSFLGIPLAYFNSLMALSGIIISFLFLYGLMRFI